MKRKWITLLVILAMITSLLMPSALASFSDTKGHWAEEYIARWEGYQVIGGYEDGSFHPDRALTRGELSAILSTIYGLQESAQNTYPDLPANDWYTPYMLKCVAAGFIAGTDVGAEPMSTVTREQAAVIFARALMVPLGTEKNTGFWDDGSVSDWAKVFVRTMKDQGIVVGTGGNMFEPQQPLTRAQAITILNAAVTQYCNTENGTVTAASSGITLIAAPNVTVTGNADTILVAPGASNGKVVLKDCNVSNELRIEAENVEIVTEGNSSAPNRRYNHNEGSARDGAAKAYAFRYNCENADFNGTIYYTDDYFKTSARRDAPDVSLATTSINFAVAAFGAMDSEEYSDKDRHVRNLLSDLGFGNYECSETFRQKPTDDSIAIAAGSKKLSGTDCTLIATAVRGGGYEAEWAGNFTVGKTGPHADFQMSADYCMNFLNNYIEKNNITGRIKIWLTGYSRGGAIGNLMAGALDRGEGLPDSVTLAYEDLYAYFFEPPQGAVVEDDLQNARYNNIWNILNYNDVVPLAAMSELGFGRYGRDFYLPRATQSNYWDQREKMLEIYNTQESIVEAGQYTVDDFQMKKLDLANGGIVDDMENSKTSGEFIRELVHKITVDQVKTRDNFVNEYQNGFRTVLHIVFGKSLLTGSEGDLNRFFDALQKNVQEENTAEELAQAIAQPWDENGLKTVISDVIVESMNDAEVNALDPVTLTKFINAVVKLVGGLAIDDPDMTVTLVSNLTQIMNAHYPEVGMAWLKTMDPNYTANPYPLPQQ